MVSQKLPYFEKGDHGNIAFAREFRHTSVASLLVFFIFIGVFFFLLFFRLFQLTIVKGAYYKKLAEENRIREIVIEPQRGMILDRKGYVLAQNLKDVSSSTEDRVTSMRKYTDGEAFAHIIGYRQTADEKDFADDDCLAKLKLGDKTGKKGAEKLFECQLRGVHGKKLIEVDARGKYINTLNIVPPVEGQTIKLAVDYELQKKAYDIIKGKRAVVIALKPNTGEVLTLAASPSFNPQDFEDNVSSKITSYFTDPLKPMFNRATEGTYPPGSIFKLVIASAGLESKSFDENWQVQDNGFIKSGQTTFGNWYWLQYGKTEGPVNLIKAIQRSNDTYFYEAGEKIGPELIKQWSEKLGYERPTGIGLAENAGIIPSPYWKDDVLHEKWFTGDTYNLSIGQGYVLSSPLQVAQSAAVFAQNGNVCRPLLLKAGSTNDPDIKQYATPDCKPSGISQKTLSIIREGMKEACTTGGTAWPLFDFSVGDKSNPQKIQLGCKTGTAESHAESGIPHAWFTVFAPFDNPEIAVTVLVEEGGQGSDVASPIAKEILKAYFDRSE